MLILYPFLIFLSLSVAAIPLSPRSPVPNGLPSLSSLPLGSLPALPALPDLPAAAGLLSPFTNIKRFIMDADYATGSGPPPFFGKSPHKRADP
jgi:hypothetical protein